MARCVPRSGGFGCAARLLDAASIRRRLASRIALCAEKHTLAATAAAHAAPDRALSVPCARCVLRPSTAHRLRARFNCACAHVAPLRRAGVRPIGTVNKVLLEAAPDVAVTSLTEGFGQGSAEFDQRRHGSCRCGRASRVGLGGPRSAGRGWRIFLGVLVLVRPATELNLLRSSLRVASIVVRSSMETLSRSVCRWRDGSVIVLVV